VLLSGNKPAGKPAPEKPRPQFEHLEPQTAQPIELTTLDKLRELRKKKVDEANQLDREIEQLDRDISFIERHPQSVHTMEMIARRFAS